MSGHFRAIGIRSIHAAVTLGVIILGMAIAIDALSQPVTKRLKPRPTSVEAVDVPLVFSQNVGQLEKTVLFQHRAPWGTIAMGRGSLEFHMRSARRSDSPGMGPLDSLDRPAWSIQEGRVLLRIHKAARMARAKGVGRLRARAPGPVDGHSPLRRSERAEHPTGDHIWLGQ